MYEKKGFHVPNLKMASEDIASENLLLTHLSYNYNENKTNLYQNDIH